MPQPFQEAAISGEHHGQQGLSGISATLGIASEALDPACARVVGNRIKCCLPRDWDTGTIKRGVEWLAKHFSVQRNSKREQRGSR